MVTFSACNELSSGSGIDVFNWFKEWRAGLLSIRSSQRRQSVASYRPPLNRKVCDGKQKVGRQEVGVSSPRFGGTGWI